MGKKMTSRERDLRQTTRDEWLAAYSWRRFQAYAGAQLDPNRVVQPYVTLDLYLMACQAVPHHATGRRRDYDGLADAPTAREAASKPNCLHATERMLRILAGHRNGNRLPRWF